MVDVEKTLAERGTRYGEFEYHAIIAQKLKLTCIEYSGTKLEPIHSEAIDMICHKLARILNGDPNYADSWHDIAGYAVLVEQWILKNQNKQPVNNFKDSLDPERIA